MNLFDVLLIFIALLTLHYVYFIVSIFLGLNKVEKTAKKLIPKKNELSDAVHVTVIIPFRNETEVILDNLRSIQQLNYPTDFLEVLYIDDNSDDDSCNILEKNIENKNIKLLKLSNGQSDKANKKQAVEYGISLAKGDIIFASDADCTYDKNWIRTVLKFYDEKTGFVAGPVDFNISDTLLSRVQQLEHAGLILTGAGLIGSNNPIICSGANISFRKDLFNELKGYSGYLDFASGDDSFLMTKVFYDSNYEVRFCYDKKAMVQTRANNNVNEFLNQRKRWVGKAFFYKKKKILLQVVLLALFLISLPVQLLFGFLVSNLFVISFLIALILKIFVEFLVMNKGIKKIYGIGPMKWFLVTELIHIPYTVVTVLLGFFGNFKWKGRTLKR